MGEAREGSVPLELVKRQCLVCDWKSIAAETPAAEGFCPVCQAPTSRTVLLADVSALEGSVGKNPHAAALGRLGAQRGGLARARRLTAQQRTDIARKAARARWTTKKR